MSTLPFELIEDILRRLPVKTLKRFRVVAKLWCYLIDSDQFVKSHLHRSLISNFHPNLIIGGIGIYSINLDSLDKANVIKAPFDFKNHDRICNSCNGIVLVASDPPVLWNPISRDYKVLPKLPVGYPTGVGLHRKIKYGFGYDSRNDYKVVCVGEFTEADLMCSKAWIYGLKSNCWRSIEAFPYQDELLHRLLPFFRQQFSLHVNGALHSHITEGDDRMRIMAFSVESEEHYEVMLPPRIEMSFGSLRVFDGCLSLDYYRGPQFFIWVMKEYGVTESWTKLLSLSVSPSAFTTESFLPVVYSRKRDKILLNCSHQKLLWYDLSRGTFEHVAVDGMPSLFYAETFVETLISPQRVCRRKRKTRKLSRMRSTRKKERCGE